MCILFSSIATNCFMDSYYRNEPNGIKNLKEAGPCPGYSESSIARIRKNIKILGNIVNTSLKFKNEE